MKTELLKKSLSFLKTLEQKQNNGGGGGEREDSLLSQPALHSDPVRKECYHMIVVLHLKVTIIASSLGSSQLFNVAR